MEWETGYGLTVETLQAVTDSTLFYPCSGEDLRVPIALFAPYVTDFWFVDRGYFRPGHQDTRFYGFDRPANQQPPLLGDHDEYCLVGTPAIKGPPVWPADGYEVEPCILTETYLHLPSHRQIRVHRRRGYGRSAFHKEISSLGVFFYRGDSLGEGGSGNLWMARYHVHELCDKLINGGLIVTDGSNRGWNREHGRMWDHSLSAQQKVDSRQQFVDQAGHQFSCVGYAGVRYGPTLVWQVQKRDGQAMSPGPTEVK